VIDALLRTKKSIEKLKSVSFNELPTVKKVVSTFKHEDAAITYHSVQPTQYEEGMTFVEQCKNEMMESVLSA